MQTYLDGGEIAPLCEIEIKYKVQIYLNDVDHKWT